MGGVRAFPRGGETELALWLSVAMALVASRGPVKLTMPQPLERLGVGALQEAERAERDPEVSRVPERRELLEEAS